MATTSFRFDRLIRNFIHVVVFNLHLNLSGRVDIYYSGSNCQSVDCSADLDLVGDLDDSALVDWGDSDLE